MGAGSISNALLVPHAAPGSNTEGLCCEALKKGMPVYTFESTYNARLMAAGAKTRLPDIPPA
jgi:hypothetical protein